jgi:uncharacterized SAM-binding protein YcdF (DUF218 family)
MEKPNQESALLYLSKLATAFITPLGFFLALGLAGLVLLVARRRASGLLCVTVALVGLWLAATPLAARLTLGALEARYPALSAADSPAADIAIVLGGGTRGPAPPRPGPDLGEAADRVLFAADLFKAGKVRRIVVSGGNIPWDAATEPEAETIAKLLVSWGVPESAIITAGSSRTTAENAREVEELWPALGASSALLVTSASHMPRALAAFRKSGLPVTPAATDVRIVQQPLVFLDLLPDSQSLDQTSDAAKEVIGSFIYWLRGDI